MGRSIIAFLFFNTTFIYLLTWFNLCLYCAVSQDIQIICWEVVLCIISLYCFCLFQRSVRALFAAEAHTYRKWKPIHARKFGYDVGVRPVSVHTDSEGRAKKLSRDREGSLRHMCCCSFRRKINYFMNNQRSCSSKDLVWSFLSSASNKIFRK